MLIRGVTRTELLLRTPRKNLEIIVNIASKIGTALKGKNLLPEGGSKSFSLRVVPMTKNETILCYALSVANIFPYAHA